MNKVQLMGNLARDPKVSVTRTGKTLVRMTVACSEIYKGKDGQAKEITSFVPVTCWPPSSDSAQDLLKEDVYYKISWGKQYTLCERIKNWLNFILRGVTDES